MWVLVAFVVVSAVGTAAALFCSRGGTERHDAPPWVLSDLAGKHVGIMGGLAGFAVTGIVLIVGLARGQPISATTPLSTVVIMMLVAYFFYVGNAFLFSYLLPSRESNKNVPPRVHFSLGTMIEYRTLFVSWLALMPLLDAYGFVLPRQVLTWLVPISMLFGSVIVTMLMANIGLMRFKETVVAMLLSAVLAHAYGALVAFALPNLRSEFSSIAVAVVIFGLNGVAFVLAALTPLSPRYPAVEVFFERYGRRIAIVDMTLTVTSLSLLGLAVAGTI
jgi:hypothetical protein